MNILRLSYILLSAALLSACAGNAVRDADTMNVDDLFPSATLAEEIEAAPQHLRLDVGVMEFDENYTLEEAKAYEVYPEVRRAEAKYFAVRLRDTMRKRDHWRSVWVVPKESVVDIKVGGKIIRSDGKYLELAVTAIDAKGSTLLRKVYKEEASQYDYSAGREPFENLFQEIVDDLLLKTASIDADDTRAVQRATDMRFVRWLAPEILARSKKESNGQSPRHSAVYQQAVRLREYDALFFDKLQDYYDQFNRQIKKPHTDWAKESYQEIEAKEEAQSEAVMQGIGGAFLVALGVAAAVAGSNSSSTGTRDTAIVAGAAAAAGGGAIINDARQKYKRSQIHDDAIQELGAALEAEVKPHRIALEGDTVQLDGSIKEQYLQWRHILKEHHRAVKAGAAL